jgi:multidrug transporter EmrE-like cation transporter|tara:strand:+ start:133 stop:663 length:531 start_codon:yes stop_codon:yes gene_type:complete
MEKSLKSVSVPYGVYAGLALSIITVLAYAFNLELFTKWWLGVGNFLIVLVLGIFAVRAAKKISTTDYFSFKQAFTAYFIVPAIGLLIAVLVSILIFNVVDPQAAQTVTEMTAETTRNMMENFNVPQADIDKAVADIESNNQFSFVNLLKAYVFQLAFFSAIGLIVALVFREKNPNA